MINDRFKFRAWDENSYKMYYFDDFRNWTSFEDADYFYNKAGEGLIWMQWTGFLDKNKTEIYESDIVETCFVGEKIWKEEKRPYKNGVVEKTPKGLVIFDNCLNIETLHVGAVNLSNGSQSPIYFDKYDGIFNFKQDAKELKIIGNKY